MRRRGSTGSFWPSRLQEDLLRLALDPEIDVARAWRELQPLELETLEEGAFALLPLVHRRLEDAGIDDPRLPRLAGTYRSTWVRNQVQLEQLPGLLSALAEGGIEPLVVGGAAVATRYYAQLGLRPILQLELVVAQEEGARAGSLLGRHGWRIEFRKPGRTSRLVGTSARVTIVLHEGPPAYFSGPVEPAAALAALREAAEERTISDVRAVTLAPADELLLACALGARRTAWPGIQWLVDVHHVLALGAFDLQRLAERARAQRLVCPLRETLEYLAARTGTAARVAEVTALLDRERPTARERLAYRLAANGLGPLGQSPEVVVEYLRRSLDEPAVPVVKGLPAALGDAWGLERGRQVPLEAARKVLRRARRAGRGAPARQSPARGRSGSTSS